MRRKRILWIALIALVALNLMVTFSAGAESPDPKVVRVGLFESVFNRTDRFGRRSGYGYEYQQRIAAYTGWTYEYVEGTWPELYEKLIVGEIDLLSDVSHTEDRAQKILYSAEAMGSEEYLIFMTPGNPAIRAGDFSTFDGKRVGVNKNSLQEKLFIEWAEKNKIHPEIIELSVKDAEQIAMLARGEIDLLVTQDIYGVSADVVPVGKVGKSEIFFGVSRNRPDLKQDLDIAMNRILESNRDFNQELAGKFNKIRAIDRFLSDGEMEWLSRHGVIRVGYKDELLPYCDMDEERKTLTGALAEYLSFAENAEKNARLRFTTQPYASTEAAIAALHNGEIDCVFPLNLSAFDAEQLGVTVTDSLGGANILTAVRTADGQGISREREMTVAVPRGNHGYEVFLKDHFPNWRPEYYKDRKSAYHAVASGKVDCMLLSNYRIALESSELSRHKLTVVATGQVMELSFLVRRQDGDLYSILNKITRQFSDTAFKASLAKYALRDTKVSFGDFVKDNLAGVVAATAVLAAVIFWLQLRNARSEKTIREGRQVISEVERDHLTDLYNWNFFLVYANRLYRAYPDKPMDAVVINIDRFHSVNALYGRDFGDTVLHKLGEEIKNFLAETEGLGSRYGADRFDIYCVHREDWPTQLKRFQARMDEHFRNAGIRLRMGVKPWEAGMDPVLQFDCARTACNARQGDYQNRIMIYDTELEQQEERDQRLMNDLERALAKRQVEVYYQPKYDIRPDRPALSSAEALVRWRHPELGMISPAVFIPLFERSGQIRELDRFVWTEAVRQMAAWRERYGKILPVSINLSRLDLFDPNLSSILDEIVKKYGVERRNLKLEVTESAYTENADQLIGVIEQLRSKGYEIEMDDFGSGYSSLNMLSSMPVDILKMDMAFVRNIAQNEKDRRLVELIVNIARNLKMPVIAEGVETEAQLKLLRDAGCDLVQGYYFSKPLPADEFEQKILKAAF